MLESEKLSTKETYDFRIGWNIDNSKYFIICTCEVKWYLIEKSINNWFKQPWDMEIYTRQKEWPRRQFTGEVITSINHIMIPTWGNWFQKTHWSMNRIIVLIFCVHFTNGKDIAVQWQIWWHLLQYCGSVKPKFKSRVWILVLVRVFWVRISKIYWQLWHSFKFFIPWRKWQPCSLFETCVKDIETFAYIMMLHFNMNRRIKTYANQLRQDTRKNKDN